MKEMLKNIIPRSSLYAAITAASFISGRPNSFLSPYKPIIGDLVKSSSVLLSLPFSVGDKVSINTDSGRVKEISMRFVTLDCPEYHAFIPTHMLYNSVIRKYK
ncbi:hypothetical protein NEFER03_0288 [Nematocida sp. LUAm3]|nr:hypothetical protein NEFER03_0288 [Nematocida sp. LUAm3]KAI5173740.1 hypothetical protein NEFER02_0256 [Nematocida sp. LUAm2]KAI5176963.1 hypothetical protein NEFER01_0288 [Nematocida sp. LUAm1]